MGETLEWNSFLFEGKYQEIGKIDFNSFEAKEEEVRTVYKVLSIMGDKTDPEADIWRLLYYMVNGTGHKIFDIKRKGGNTFENMYRGSQIAKKVYVSARDAGNFIAGRIAGKYKVGYERAAIAFGALNIAGNGSVWDMAKAMLRANLIGPINHYGERPISAAFQKRGYFNNTK